LNDDQQLQVGKTVLPNMPKQNFS